MADIRNDRTVDTSKRLQQEDNLKDDDINSDYESGLNEDVSDDSGIDESSANRSTSSTSRTTNRQTTPPTNPYAGGYGAPGTPAASKNLATGGGVPQPSTPEETAYLQQLAQQGLTNDQIKQQFQSTFGREPTDVEILYAKQGFGSFPGGVPSKYNSYAGPNYNTVAGGGSPYLLQYIMDQQMLQETKQQAAQSKNQAKNQEVRIHMILLLIMMGDIVGALTLYGRLWERDNQKIYKKIVDKMEKVRQARALVIRNFAMEPTPRAYAGGNPQLAATAQDRTQKFTQFVQLNTQLMNELSSTQTELSTMLQDVKRERDLFMQFLKNLADEHYQSQRQQIRGG
jgi:hypothetical protein